MNALAWVCRNRTTGKIILAQFPNKPLWVFIIATATQLVLHSSGVVATVGEIVGAVALSVWAILEIGWGVSPFRRMLGAVVLVGETIVHVHTWVH